MGDDDMVTVRFWCRIVGNQDGGVTAESCCGTIRQIRQFFLSFRESLVYIVLTSKFQNGRVVCHDRSTLCHGVTATIDSFSNLDIDVVPCNKW